MESHSDDELTVKIIRKAPEAAEGKGSTNEDRTQHSCVPFRIRRRIIREEKSRPSTPIVGDVPLEEGEIVSTPIPREANAISPFHKPSVLFEQSIEQSTINSDAAAKFISDMQKSLLRDTSPPRSPSTTTSQFPTKTDDKPREFAVFEGRQSNESLIRAEGSNRYFNPATKEEFRIFTPNQSAEGSKVPSRASSPLLPSGLNLEEYHRRQGELAPVLGILRDFRFEDEYEVVVNPPVTQINRRLNRHHPIYIGSYIINFRLTFGERDSARMQNIAEMNNLCELTGMLQLFTNRTPLYVIKQALRSQYGFTGLICTV